MKKKKTDLPQKDIVIYQASSGAIELRGDFTRENIWATQAQIARAFEVDVRTVNEHIQNIYTSKELREKATIRKFRIVQQEGARKVEREIGHYNLDMILSVGYRVNSKKSDTISSMGNEDSPRTHYIWIYNQPQANWQKLRCFHESSC